MRILLCQKHYLKRKKTCNYRRFNARWPWSGTCLEAVRHNHMTMKNHDNRSTDGATVWGARGLFDCGRSTPGPQAIPGPPLTWKRNRLCAMPFGSRTCRRPFRKLVDYVRRIHSVGGSMRRSSRYSRCLSRSISRRKQGCSGAFFGGRSRPTPKWSFTFRDAPDFQRLALTEQSRHANESLRVRIRDEA